MSLKGHRERQGDGKSKGQKQILSYLSHIFIAKNRNPNSNGLGGGREEFIALAKLINTPQNYTLSFFPLVIELPVSKWPEDYTLLFHTLQRLHSSAYFPSLGGRAAG